MAAFPKSGNHFISGQRSNWYGEFSSLLQGEVTCIRIKSSSPRYFELDLSMNKKQRNRKEHARKGKRKDMLRNEQIWNQNQGKLKKTLYMNTPVSEPKWKEH